MRVSMKYNGPQTECESSMTFQYGEVEDYCLNIKEFLSVHNNETLKFNIYPNPTESTVNIILPKTGKFKITFNNALGQQVMNTQINSSSMIDVNQLAPGMYTINITNDEGEFGVQRLIIQ